MTLRTASLSLVFAACWPVAAHAAEYAFTIEGRVTATGDPSIDVGDPFIISYVGNTEDTDPSPTVGLYTAGPSSLRFPNITLATPGAPQIYGVGLNGTDGTDGHAYMFFGYNYYFSMDFRFPAGTLPSDALPLSLPLSSATIATAQLYFLGTVFRGDITSYASEPVPEPAHLGLFGVGVVLIWPRRARQ